MLGLRSAGLGRGLFDADRPSIVGQEDRTRIGRRVVRRDDELQCAVEAALIQHGFVGGYLCGADAKRLDLAPDRCEPDVVG